MTGRILIQDSSASNRIILRCKLSASCYDVRAVEALDDVFAHLRDVPTDILILDWDHDPAGVQHFCQQSMTRHPGIGPWILATTAAPSPEMQIRALSCGIAAVVPKPMDEELLLATLRRCLRQRKLQTEALEQTHGLHEFGADLLTPDAALTHKVAILSGQQSQGDQWSMALRPHLPKMDVTVSDPMTALSQPANGAAPDAYVVPISSGPIAEGLTLLSELRSRSSGKSARLIAVLQGQDPSPRLAAMALDLGADDVLTTGFHAGELAQKISCQLSQKKILDKLHRQVSNGLRLATRDPLTGLYNRRFALPRMERMLDEAQRRGQPISVLALDLDHFKAVNDTHGHAAGDAVLVEMAKRMSEALRPRDLLARSGGEEFLIAVPNADRNGAHRLAARIQDLVRRSPVTMPGLQAGAVKVTISIGVATLSPNTRVAGDAMARLLHDADTALYAAKADGRDTVSHAGFAA